MKQLTFMAILSLFLFSSCEKEHLSANGNRSTETRNFNEFNSLKIEGASNIYVAYGNEYKVVIKGSNNLIPYYKTTLVNRNLNIGYENATVRNDDIEVYITMPLLKSASLSGSGDLELSGNFESVNVLDLSLTGSGGIAIADPIVVMQLKLDVSGSGDADLQKASCKSADISIVGSGDAKVQVADFLKVRMSGSGNVYYQGSPQVDTKISGSGGIIKI